MSEKITQTAGRMQLGEFAPMFAHLNDDVLFGEVWNEEAIDVKTKCIITVVSLMASGITDSSLSYHLQNAKNHGVTRAEIAAIITHATMYVGWPKGWAVFRLAKEIWNEAEPALTGKDAYQNEIFFPIGEENPYGQFFVGQSYLAPVSTEQVLVFNVTFEPGCRNNGHRGEHPRQRQALARRRRRQLVFPPGHRGGGGGSLQRVAGEGFRGRLQETEIKQIQRRRMQNEKSGCLFFRQRQHCQAGKDPVRRSGGGALRDPA